MYFKVQGAAVPQELLLIIADMTDAARLNPRDLVVDDAAGVVTLPITRFPLVKRRKVLWNIYDGKTPIPARILIHNVLRCTVEDHSEQGEADEVMLQYGLWIEGNEIFVCSAQETRGVSQFSLRAHVSELELEIIDH